MYVQLWQLFTKNDINFDQKEIERKKKISRRHKILLQIQCCHQKCQNRKKKNQLFSKNIFNKIVIFKKIQIFRKQKVYFQILEVLPVILTTYLPV